MIAGLLVALKESNPRIRVYGVEPTGAAAMRRSLDQGCAVHLAVVDTIADGLAAPRGIHPMQARPTLALRLVLAAWIALWYSK